MTKIEIVADGKDITINAKATDGLELLNVTTALVVTVTKKLAEATKITEMAALYGIFEVVKERLEKELKE